MTNGFGGIISFSMLGKMPIVMFALLTLSVTCIAQSQGGGAVAGIGRVYEASGRSAASRDLQRKLGGTLVRAVARERSAARRATATDRGRPARASSAVPTLTPADASTDDSAAYFKPDSQSDTMKALADQLGTNATERQQLRELFHATKEAFEREVATKGRSNNLPAAFTFFIASTVTVYRDDPEPSDKAIDSLWDGMSGALTEMPELSNLTNAEKQQLYDMLVAFSGFVLAGYMESKRTNNAETLAIFKTLSGEMIKTILQTDPEKLRFTKDGLIIGT